MEKTYHFYPNEMCGGWETLVKILLSDKGGCDVYYILKDENGQFYYGFFDAWCSSAVAMDRRLFRLFYDENDLNGCSVGSFGSVADAVADMKADGFGCPFTKDDLLLIR